MTGWNVFLILLMIFNAVMTGIDPNAIMGAGGWVVAICFYMETLKK